MQQEVRHSRIVDHRQVAWDRDYLGLGADGQSPGPEAAVHLHIGIGDHLGVFAPNAPFVPDVGRNRVGRNPSRGQNPVQSDGVLVA